MDKLVTGRESPYWLVLTLICLMFSWSEPVAEEVTVTLIHTSGFKGNLEQTLKIQPLFERIQRETGKALLLHAGSALSPGESAYKGPGKSLTVSLMDKIGVDVWVPGGDDFARSPDELSTFSRDASFPILGANLHRADETGRSLSQIQPFTIVSMGRLKIGILGLSAGGNRIEVGDPVQAARYYVPLLREAADAVILLTHLSFKADSTLAEEVGGIDIILGAQSTAGSITINDVLIGYASSIEGSVGRIDLTFAEGQLHSTGYNLLSIKGGQGPSLSGILAGWTAEVDGQMMPAAAVIGTSGGGFGSSLGTSSAMGHLIADLMRIFVGSDLAFVAASNVDPDLPEGPITVLDLFRVYGWANQVVIVSVKGSQIRDFLEGGLKTTGGFFYPSGLQVVYDPSAKKGDSITSISVGNQPLEDNKSYRATVEDRIATSEGSGKGLADFLDASGRAETGVMIRDLIARHIQTLSQIKGSVDDRVQEK